VTVRSGLIGLSAGLMLIVPAGCGTDELRTFRDEHLQPLERAIDKQRAQLSALLRQAVPGDATAAEALRALAAPLEESARSLAALDAPDVAKKAQRAYAASTARLSAELRRFSGALKSGSESEIAAAAARARDAVGALQQAEIALDDALSGG